MPGRKNEGRDHPPLVTVGLPVYNGEPTVGEAISDVLSQSFCNFELIVSDNASIDGTEEICRAFAAKDSRIRYVRQETNLGAAGNFRFVLQEARGRYFMWAASDDRRSPDFLMQNVEFLEANPDYIASTCPNCFEGEEDKPALFVDFSVQGSLAARYLQFLRNCWKSHGIFYSVMRTATIRECDIPGQAFTAADWAMDLFLASRGSIHRTERGLAVFGRQGISSQSNAWRVFRSRPVELVLPFYRFSLYALGLMKPLPWGPWFKVLGLLVMLNLKASFDQTYAGAYAFYRQHIKSTRQ